MDDVKKGTQLLEVYALEIQMYTEQKNSKKLKTLYEQSLHIKSAIPHPLIMGVIRGEEEGKRRRGRGGEGGEGGRRGRGEGENGEEEREKGGGGKGGGRGEEEGKGGGEREGGEEEGKRGGEKTRGEEVDVYLYNVRGKEGKATTFIPPPPSSWLHNEAGRNLGETRRRGEGRKTRGEEVQEE